MQGSSRDAIRPRSSIGHRGTIGHQGAIGHQGMIAPPGPERLPGVDRGPVDFLLARPVPARLLSASLLSASLLAASLLSPPMAAPALATSSLARPSLAGPSLAGPALAGSAPAQPRERARLDHPPPPLRIAALLSGEPGEHSPGVRSGRALADRVRRTGDAVQAVGLHGSAEPSLSSALSSSLFAPVRANNRNVFGSIALGMSGIAASDQWRRVLDENAGRFFQTGCGSAGAGPCSAPHWPRWTALHDRAATLPLSERIAFVNREVNRLVRYRDDEALYGRRDHWATLTETVRAGAGDCEDYAIAKMWLLEALGVPRSSMQLVALRDERRGLDHAVLAVHLHDEILLLDNVHDRVLPDAAVGHYRPMFSFAGEQGFVHGFRRPAERLAAATQ